ncbi:MAG: hypothetical protein CFE23_01835 [Flavobacterium sp. BFFFF1]|uniref:hypothetical protein n=1 Tax=Flavobacterium sp. BFFFF1 TaxID=2015557 RepID=UPI000BCABAD5|nr:hypothetical protein [Flavobacterium sp. BFFFF1]OYU82065.1 MAG: hypothetical protein CFE23_01835 [Flavobacterium sp. BFFFF1]
MRTIFYLAVFFTTICNAQNSYEAGYYIDNTGTTRTGLIENEYWYNSPSSIHFKATDQADFVTLEIKDVKSFCIGRDIKYIRQTVNIDNKRTEIHKENNSTNGNPSFEKKTLFLKVLVEGPATLCSIVYLSEPKYFFSMNNSGSFSQLFYRVYSDNDFHEKRNTLYRNQLFDALKCDKLSLQDFTTLPYQEQALAGIIQKYNSCMNVESKVYSEKVRKSEVKYSIIGGLGLTTLKVVSTENVFEKGSGSTFIFGGEVSVLLPFNNKRIELFLNSVVEKIDFKVYSEDISTGSTVTYIKDYIEMQGTPIDINVGMRYYFIVNEKNRIFLSGAFGVCLANGTIKYSRDRYTPQGIANISGFEGNTETAFDAKLGVGYMFNQKISLNVDYDIYPKNFFNEGVGINASELTVLGLTLRYRLN